MLAPLTFVAGIVDAVSILRLGHVFVSNMTGNVAFAGFAVAGAGAFSASRSLLVLAWYLVGARLGGTAARHLGHDRAALLRMGVVIELLLMSTALVVATVSGEPFSGATRHVLAAVAASAMGVQNAVVGALLVPDVGATVITRTLTRLAADRPNEQGRAALIRRSLSVVALLTGAVAGALLVFHATTATALGLAVVVLGGVTGVVTMAARRPAGWRIV